MSMSEKSRVTKAAGVVGSATFISRILGYARDMVVAAFFGAGFCSDAFITAFRIPNLLRRFFAEGTLTIAFVPVFTGYLSNKGKEEAFILARSAIRFLSVLLVFCAILGVVFSPLIVKVIAYGFTDSPEKYSLTVFLARITFPYVFFICLVALCMGILNALGHFAAPAFAPVLLNLAMIGTVYGVSLFSSDQIHRVVGLSVGVLIGGVLQLCLQIPFLIKSGLYFWKKAPFFHPGLKKIGFLMLPAVVGSGVYQFNSIAMTLLASLLAEGSISYLYFSERLVQFPLGIFAIAIGTAVLPSLSRQAAARDLDDLKETFAYALKLVFFIIIPSVFGLIILRDPIVALLYQRHAFDAYATEMTAHALLYFSIGLWAVAGVRIIVPTFYALQDARTPVRIAVVSIFANIVLGVVLMGPVERGWFVFENNLIQNAATGLYGIIPIGHGGLALATSLSSILHFFLLLYALRIKIGPLGLRTIIVSVCKSVLCSAVMGISVWAVANYMIPPEGRTNFELLIGVSTSLIVGVAVYGLLAYMVKSSEVEYILSIVGKAGLRK